MQRHDEVDDADDEDAGGEQREVLLARRLVDEAADALVVEQHLDHDEAADEVADLDGDDRDRRQERVAQHVPPDHDALRQPLQVGGPRVVAVQRLDHPGPGDAGDVAEEHERERERGQEEVLELGQRRSPPAQPARSPGSQPSQTAKTRMRTMPDTNSGIAENERPAVVMPLSVAFP